MSGSVTIRDVVIKIAIEMAQSKVRAPDFSAVDREIDRIRGKYQAAFQGGPAGGGPGGGPGGRGGGGAGYGSHYVDTSMIQGPNAPFGRASSDAIRNRLTDMRALNVILGTHENVLKRGELATLRSAAADAAAEKAANAAAKAVGRHNGALMQLIASHEGLLRIPNGSARILNMIPVQSAPLLAAGAAAAASMMDVNTRTKSTRAFMAGGGSFAPNAFVDTSLFGDNPRGADANHVIRPRGMFENVGIFTSDWSKNRMREMQQSVPRGGTGFFGGLMDAQRQNLGWMGGDVAEAEFQSDIRTNRNSAITNAERKAEVLRIGGLQRGFGFAQTRDDLLQSQGRLSPSDRLGAFDASSAATRTSILRKPKGELDIKLGTARRGSGAADFDLQSAQKRLSILHDVGSALDAERNKIMENTRAAHAQLDVERERLKSQKEAIATGDVKSVAMLKSGLNKLNAGSDLNVKEAQALRQFGIRGAENSIDQAFDKEVARRLNPKQLERAQLGKGVADAERGLADAFRNQRDALPEIEAEIAKATRETEKAMDSLVGLFEKAFDMHRLLQEVIDRIKAVEEKGQKNGNNVEK